MAPEIAETPVEIRQSPARALCATVGHYAWLALRMGALRHGR
jgi:hypothetical protein